MTVRLTAVVLLVVAATSLAACGHTTEQKAATSAIAGAAVAGPVGAAVGAGAGVVAERASRGN